MRELKNENFTFFDQKTFRLEIYNKYLLRFESMNGVNFLLENLLVKIRGGVKNENFHVFDLKDLRT